MKPGSSGKFWFLAKNADGSNKKIYQYTGDYFNEILLSDVHKLQNAEKEPRIEFDENGHLQILAGSKRRIINIRNFNLLRFDENFVNSEDTAIIGSATKSVASIILTIIAVVMLLL